MLEENEMSEEYSVLELIKKDEKIEVLEQEKKVLIEFILRKHPEMDGWIKKNFGRVKE